MADLAPFPAIEDILVTLFDDLATTGIVTPANLASQLPFVRTQRFGGGDDRITDRGLVSIDAFAASRTAARNLAEAIRQRLTTGPNVVPGVGTLDYTATVTAPNEVPWTDTQSVWRFTATYRISVRR